MSFLLRSVRTQDLEALFRLTKQFTLLNLPHDRESLRRKIETSVKAFSENRPKPESEYLFVMEDLESNEVVGSSLILAKHGTECSPHNYFRITRREHFSRDLGVGFIHQVLNFQQDTDGPTEIGGLLIDGTYRRRPEKLGRQMSLVRFVFMGMEPERFEKKVLVELSPPLTSDGRSEFWEALGRRFTGLPYQEADLLSQKNKEFIRSLFPPQDIYLSLLDARARIVVGQIGEETKPAQHLLEKLGFKYLEEVDPFDGAPHYGADIENIELIKNGKWFTLSYRDPKEFTTEGFVGWFVNGEFKAIYCPTFISDQILHIPDWAERTLTAPEGAKVFFTSLKSKEKNR